MMIWLTIFLVWYFLQSWKASSCSYATLVVLVSCHLAVAVLTPVRTPTEGMKRNNSQLSISGIKLLGYCVIIASACFFFLFFFLPCPYKNNSLECSQKLQIYCIITCSCSSVSYMQAAVLGALHYRMMNEVKKKLLNVQNDGS